MIAILFIYEDFVYYKNVIIYTKVNKINSFKVNKINSFLSMWHLCYYRFFKYEHFLVDRPQIFN
jgi:hypothetical protein